MDIIKPPSDTKIYKYIKLDNEIETIIISDKLSSLCSVTLNVGVGFMSDPVNIPGLAHFLEHMLFMGTKKYPDTNYFFTFVNKYGGNTNAMTTDEFTSYYFDIQSQYFKEAIDIFHRFFTEPLFKQDAIIKEMNAVDSEDIKNTNIDIIRLDQLIKIICHDNHPFAKFGGGNLKTLNISNIREELLKFYNTYYSANLIKVVIYTNEDINSTEEIVRSTFGKIINKFAHTNYNKLQFPFNTYTEDNIDNSNESIVCNKLIKFVPISDIQSVHIFWQIPNFNKQYMYKPIDYIINLLGHESEGMFIHHMKQDNLCTEMTVYKYVELQSFCIIHCTLILTDKGFKYIPYIIDSLFSYIELINNEAINKLYYDEMKKINQLNFEYSINLDPITTTTNIANNLLIYPPTYILYGPYCYSNYTKITEKNIKYLLTYLTRKNTIITIASNKYLDSHFNINKFEKWYNTQYYNYTNPLTFGKEFNNNKKQITKLSLPAKNKYIPHNVIILSNNNKLATEYPIKLPDKNIDIWVKKDNKFGTPFIIVQLSISIDSIFKSAKNNISVTFFIKLLNNIISSDIYYASLANSHIYIDVSNNLILIYISCYPEIINKILDKIMNVILNLKINKSEFDLCFIELETELKNYIYKQPLQLLNEYLKEKILNVYFSPNELLEALYTIEHIDILEIVNDIKNKCNIKMLIEGNINYNNVSSIIEIITKSLCSSKIISEPINKILPLNNGEQELYLRKPFNISFNDFAIGIFYEIGIIKKSKTDNWQNILCYIQLVKIFIAENFFDTLRTVEQLAYIVKCDVLTIGDYRYPLVGMLFSIQTSKKSPYFIRKRIRQFIKDSEQLFLNITDTDFMTYKKIIKTDILKESNNIYDEFKEHFNEIIREDYIFDTKYKIVETLNSIKKEDLIKFYQDFFVNNATRRVRIVEIYSKNQIKKLKNN